MRAKNTRTFVKPSNSTTRTGTVQHSLPKQLTQAETGFYLGQQTGIHLIYWAGEGKPETQVVVAIPRRDVVTVRRTRIPGVVVPAAAANHAV